MRAFSSGLAAAMAADGYQPLVEVALLKGDNDTWASGDSVMVWATGTVGWTLSNTTVDTTRLIRGRLGRIGRAVNLYDLGGLAKATKFSFSLSNMPSGASSTAPYIADLYAAGIKLQGRTVIIYLDWAGNTSPGDRYLFFTGTITEIKLTQDEIKCQVQAADLTMDIQIPPNVYENDSSAAWDDDRIPDSIVGRPIPLVLGKAKYAQGYKISDSYDDGSADHGAAIQFSDVNYSASATPISAINRLFYGSTALADACNGVADFDDAAGRSQWTAVPSKAMAYFADIKRPKIYLKALIRLKSWTAHETINNGQTNPRQGIDGDPATYASIPGATDSTTDSQRSLTFKIPRIGMAGDVQGGTSPEAYFVGKATPDPSAGWVADWGAGGTPVAWGPFVDNGTTLQGFGFYTPCKALATTGTIDNMDDPDHWEDYQLVAVPAFGTPSAGYYDEVADYSDGFIGVGNTTYRSGVAAGWVHVYDAALFLKWNSDMPDDGFLAEIDGHIDNSLGEYTGTGSKLIETPCECAQFLMYGVANAAYLPPSSFAIGESTRGFVLGFQLSEQDSLAQVIDEIGKESLEWFWFDQNAEKGHAFVNGEYYTAEGIHVIDTADLINGHIRRSWWNPATHRWTALTMRYKLNPVTNGYVETIFVNKDDVTDGFASLQIPAQTAYDDLGVEREYKLDLDLVADDTTAANIFTKAFHFLAADKFYFEFELDLSGSQYQIGDLILITGTAPDDTPDRMAGSVSRILKTDIDLARGTVRITARVGG